MAASKLRQVLERDAGSRKFHWVIPYTFLPPRYRKQSNGRNLVLLLDQDFTLHLRWEGDRLNEHLPLAPRAAVRLLKETKKSMAEYKRELDIFSRFVLACGERPLEETTSTKGERPASAWKDETLMVEEDLSPSGSKAADSSPTEKGGEGPMGIPEDFLGE